MKNGRNTSPPPCQLAIPKCSFASTLTDHWQSIKNKNLLAKNTLDELIRVVKTRIALEESYSRGLAKLSHPISSTSGYKSLNDAVVSFTSDILNKSVQHKELAGNLQTDVLIELQSLREHVYKGGKVRFGTSINPLTLHSLNYSAALTLEFFVIFLSRRARRRPQRQFPP